jgi:hypothetical protein
MTYKVLYITAITFISLNLYSQKNLFLHHIDSLHDDYNVIFKAYTESIIGKEYKSKVFVQIGYAKGGSELQKFVLKNKMPDGMSLSLNLVSSVEGSSEMFDEKSVYGEDIVGYVSYGPIIFILYSRHNIEAVLSDSIRRLDFDDFDLRGYPVQGWHLIKYRGNYYKRIDF